MCGGQYLQVHTVPNYLCMSGHLICHGTDTKDVLASYRVLLNLIVNASVRYTM